MASPRDKEEAGTVNNAAPHGVSGKCDSSIMPVSFNHATQKDRR
jgi:hypothetical protein